MSAYKFSIMGQSMVSVEDIQKILPAWPPEVVKQWLHYFANDLGWPPPEPLGNHRWNGILGGRPLSWWKNVTWKKETSDFSLANLSQRSRDIANELKTEFSRGTADAVTTRRFKQAYIYIMDNAKFYEPVLAIKRPDGLSIIDGNHRVGAFCMLQQTPDSKFAELKKKKAALEQEVWIGTHSGGELPLT